MAIGNVYNQYAAYASIGTTSSWFHIGWSSAGASRHQKYDGLVVYNAGGSTAWVKIDGTTAKAATNGNVPVKAGAQVLIPYTSKVSVVAAAAGGISVRGLPRSIAGPQ